MKLGLDYRPALINREGIGRYTRELVRALVRLDDAPELGLFGWSLAPDRSTAEERGLQGSTARLHRLRFPARWFPALCRWSGRGADDWVGGTQLWHHTQPSLLPVRAAREVTTIFDLIYMRGGGFLSDEAAERMTASAREAIARSQLVFVPSQFVADDLVRTLDVERSKLRVTWLGCDHALRGEDRMIPAPPREARDAILTLSRVDRRKNHLAMLRAFEILGRTHADLRWVVAGPRGHGAEEFDAALARSSARERVERHDFISEQELCKLWSRTALFWFTSLDEGFGLPPLEAMLRGIPTLASTSGSLPEVLGSAAVLLDPKDVEGLARRSAELRDDPDLWAARSAAAAAWASSFTWERCAQATLSGYRECLR
jgi:glycosyltransferase involved in cell wall biosynthesis